MRRRLALICVTGVLVATLPAGWAAAAAPGKDVPAAPSAATGLPAADVARMAKQKPLVDAATRIFRAAEGQRGITGISLGTSSVDVYWKGAVPAKVRNAVRAEKTVPVTIHAAAYSRAELKTAETKLLAHIKAHPGAVFGVELPVAGDGLVALTESAPTSAGLSAQRVALPDVGVRVNVKADRRPATASRQADTNPFWGGATIVTGGAGCSSGFGVRNSAGTTFVVTASHCGNVGNTWTNGTGTSTLGVGSNESVANDVLLVKGSASGRIYDGGGTKVYETRSQFSKAVSGWSPVFANQYLCQSGAVSGAVCNLKNDAITGYSYCSSTTGECYSDLVNAQKPSGIAVRPGDSGGPTFLLDGDKVKALGINSGGSYYPFNVAVNGRCLDADLNAIGTNGARVQLWACNGSAQQAWFVRGDGSVANAKNSSFCLDADLSTGGGNGAQMRLWTCNGSAQQRFNYGGEGPGDMRVASNGRCVDADLNAIGTNGARVQLWDCNGSNQQRWNVPSSNVIYQDYYTARALWAIDPILG